MRICFFGPSADHQQFLLNLDQLPRHASRIRRCDHFTDYDSFISHLRRHACDAVFVAENNANGMEGVIAAKNIRPNLPVVWFSNDEGFGCQAYRLNTVFFHSKPITHTVLEMAMERLIC